MSIYATVTFIDNKGSPTVASIRAYDNGDLIQFIRQHASDHKKHCIGSFFVCAFAFTIGKDDGATLYKITNDCRVLTARVQAIKEPA